MSSNTNIGNTPVNQGYVQLIHTGETGGIDGTLRTLYDGDGTASDLQIASNAVKISTQLYIGSKTIIEYVQDVVGDMFDTNGSHTNITATYDDDGDGAIDLVSTGEVTLTGTETLTNKTLASPTFTGTANGANLTLTGDLTVSGDTIFTNSNNVLIGDAILTLNADETGSPTANAGFEVERGTSANKSFVWNETDDKWTIGSETFVAGTVEANLTGNVTGSASLNLLKSNNLSDLTNASTARTNLGVDPAGTDNSTNVTLAGSLDYITLSGQEITRNAINLTTDVTGTLPVGNGGTGLTSISTLLNSNVTPSSLGLVIGTNVQAQDDSLEDISLIDTSGLGLNDTNKFIAWSGSSADFVLSSFPATQMSGSTNNGLLTFNSASVASVESNLTFDGTNLDLPDSKKVRFGTDNDFEMYHDNTNAVINNTKGDLQIYNNADDKDIVLLSDDGAGGTTTYLQLDGSAERIQFSKKAYILDNVKFEFGDGADLQIYHDGSNSSLQNNTGVFYINQTASASMSLQTNNIQALEITSAQVLVPRQDVKMQAGKKLYLDGGGHTYISETSNDVLKIFVGNEAKLEIDEGNENIFLNTNNLTFRTPGFTAQSKFDILNNKLGIGTTSPSQKLDIQDGQLTFTHSSINQALSGRIRFNEYSNESNVSGAYIQYNGASNYLQMFTNTESTDYEFLRALRGSHLALQPNGGNVGIGTTSPGYKLDVAGTIRTTGELYLDNGGDAIAFMGVSDANYRKALYASNDDHYVTNRHTGGDLILMSNNGSAGGETERLRFVAGSGTQNAYFSNVNVGIGTNSPESKLNIVDSGETIIRLYASTASTRSGIWFTNGSYSYGTNIGTDNKFHITGNINSEAELVTVDSSGNVLIGGTSASGHGFNLEVLNDHAYVKGPDGWNGTGDKAIVALGSGVSNESFGCGYVYGTGLVLSTYKLSGGGDFGSSTQNSLVIADTTGQASFINDVIAYASSDKRLKENIKPLDNALDKIKKINGVEFDWIDGKDEHGNSVHSNEGHDVGVIAQEIEEVLPEVVHTRDNGYKAVKYEKIVPLLIQAIKEQQQQIEELKNG